MVRIILKHANQQKIDILRGEYLIITEENGRKWWVIEEEEAVIEAEHEAIE